MSIKYILTAVAFLGFVGLGAYDTTQHKQQIQLKDIQLKSTTTKLNEIQLDYKALDTKQQELLQNHDSNQQQLDQIKKERDELDRRNKELEAQIQARAAEKARLASLSTTKKVSAATAPVNGSCDEWLVAAGVTDLASAKDLIRRESGCNPYAVNKSSGACGVAQELPCGKSGCKLGDGACQVKWMDSYVKSRYGSWANALAHSYSHNWY